MSCHYRGTEHQTCFIAGGLPILEIATHRIPQLVLTDHVSPVPLDHAKHSGFGSLALRAR